jgi:WD40 repeat protein
MVASSSLADHQIRLWDVATGESRRSLSCATSSTQTFTCLAFAPSDCFTLVAGNEHGVVTFWNLATWHENAPLHAHKGWVKTLAMSIDGKILVTGGNDGFVRIWDAGNVLGRG